MAQKFCRASAGRGGSTEDAPTPNAGTRTRPGERPAQLRKGQGQKFKEDQNGETTAVASHQNVNRKPTRMTGKQSIKGEEGCCLKTASFRGDGWGHII